MVKKITSLAIACAVLAFTEPAHAEGPATPVIGYLESYATSARWFESFRGGLRELGYVENRTIVIERRSAHAQTDRLPDLASELVRLRPRVIVASTATAALAAKKVTATIPIVMTNTTDPVRLGLIESLARPGGNVTGLSSLSPGLSGKRLELLKGIVPGLARVGVIGDVRRGAPLTNYRQMQVAAGAMGLAIELFEVRRSEDFDAAFRAAAERVGAVAVLKNPVVVTHRKVVLSAAARHKVPAIYLDSQFVFAGGLLSYGASTPDLHRRAAAYVDKILKGAKPADIPVEQPTRFELVVNLKTAKALGITVPAPILLSADEVIE